MTRRSDFTRAEWDLLGNAPLAASAAVAIASPGGGAREANAIISSWREANAMFPNSELLQAIIAELDPQDREARERSAGLRARSTHPTFDDIVDEAITLCGQAVALLERKAPAEEQEVYKAFVSHIMARVAQATNESGFLGMGSQPVSPAERSVMQDIADALYGRSAG